MVNGLHIEELLEGIRVIVEELSYLSREEGLNLPVFFTISFLSIIISTIFTGTYITASVSIGQLVRKHRIGGAILAGSMILILYTTIHNTIQLPLLVSSILVGENISSLLMAEGISLIILIIFTVVLYCVSEYIMTKKLNLE